MWRSGTIGTETQVSFSDGVHERQAATVQNTDDDKYLVSWQYKGSDNVNNDVLAQRLSEQGTVLTTETI